MKNNIGLACGVALALCTANITPTVAEEASSPTPVMCPEGQEHAKDNDQVCVPKKDARDETVDSPDVSKQETSETGTTTASAPADPPASPSMQGTEGQEPNKKADQAVDGDAGAKPVGTEDGVAPSDDDSADSDLKNDVESADTMSSTEEQGGPGSKREPGGAVEGEKQSTPDSEADEKIENGADASKDQPEKTPVEGGQSEGPTSQDSTSGGENAEDPEGATEQSGKETETNADGVNSEGSQSSGVTNSDDDQSGGKKDAEPENTVDDSKDKGTTDSEDTTTGAEAKTDPVQGQEDQSAGQGDAGQSGKDGETKVEGDQSGGKKDAEPENTVDDSKDKGTTDSEGTKADGKDDTNQPENQNDNATKPSFFEKHKRTIAVVLGLGAFGALIASVFNWVAVQGMPWLNLSWLKLPRW